MSLATFKDLCLDASDASVLGAFWATALGLELHHETDGDAFLTGPTGAHTVWINQVPEAKTAKNRIHLDVHGSSVDELEAAGAVVLDATSFRWVVMADPDGGEFCLFVRDAPPEYRLYELAIDCVDHEATSRWWAQVLGGNRVTDDRGFSYIERIPNVPFDNITFVSVEEPKAVKNRVHIDIVSDDVGGLLAAGATMLRRRDDEIAWDVLADPEGNEFCVFAARLSL